MASASATSWTFGDGRAGAVTASRYGRVVRVKLRAREVAVISLLTGKCMIRLRQFPGDGVVVEPPSIQLNNVFNRMFDQVGAVRYSTEFKRGAIWLVDGVKNTRTQVTASGITLVLPTKSVLKLIVAFDCGAWEISTWLNHLEQDRQSALENPQAAVEPVQF